MNTLPAWVSNTMAVLVDKISQQSDQIQELIEKIEHLENKLRDQKEERRLMLANIEHLTMKE